MIVRKKFLLLDERNIHELDNARVVVNQPICHPENPIFSSEKGFWDASRGEVGWPLHVMFDADAGHFRPWYSFGSVPYYVPDGVVEKPWWQLAYATSEDGINWERPNNIEQVEWNGSRRNNLLDAPPVCAIFEDPSETIADRRFKMVFTPSDIGDGEALVRAGLFCPICIAYSPDGISWTVPRLRYSRRPDEAINRPINPVIPEGTDAIDMYS